MSSTIKLENTARRDVLIDIEKKYQKVWADEKIFEVDAPTLDEEPDVKDSDELHKKHPKFFGCMAYPYANGVLHAGHAFSISKVEFAAGFERMRGKKVLFPQGFHCTGMPIKASADKIKREVEEFGKDFSNVPAREETAEETPSEPKKREDLSKFTSKKSKATAKQGRGVYQHEIMISSGIPKEEIHKFADPLYWLEYFPALVQKHLVSFGGRIDWRRSFITTDVNPYYDAFVKWHINRLKQLNKIKFGERYTIYSEKDGQACLDHDRLSGENVNPQEYTGIKIKVLEFTSEATQLFKENNFDIQNKNIYLVAATLRPETMYGQTCCFVSPKINYGIFDAGNGDYFICTERAFKNMSFQKITPKRGYYKPETTIIGKALVGSRINAPLSVYKEVHVLPMETVLESKGTGVVTCVPSDSPDDFATTRDLYNKPEYYAIKQEWVNNDILPLIKTEKYGDKCAEYLVNDLKIQSPKDTVQLAKAKELAYKEGYYNGTIIVGKYKGEKVPDVKPKIKADLIASGDAFVYYEPEGLVISRSGDVCVVSLEDQWYIDYGEDSWKSLALEGLANMNTFNKETRHAFEGVLDWLKNWAVTRYFGLGTKLPWDESLLVESLSDSTVYMAYYTICHFLHGDFYGRVPGKFKIDPSSMTEEVFDYVFGIRDEVKSDIPLEHLNVMRREFEYFYPLDVRYSGKDLVANHLTFFLYTHVAIFPKKFWPKGVRVNGHLMLNNAKMSKSTGNFLTLEQLVEKFGADASRIALADAGDTVEDANFDESNANSAILRLTTLKEWCEEMVQQKDKLRTGPLDSFFDKAFNNEMDDLMEKTYEQYNLTNYRAALKYGLFDYQTVRDYYRDSVTSNIGMHKDLVLKYIETQALLLAPIAPHFCEYLYRDVLGKSGSVQSATFPRPAEPASKSITDAVTYVKDLSRSIREAEANVLKRKKGKPSEIDASKPVRLTLFVSKTFPEWQDHYIELVRELFEQQSLSDNKLIKEKVGSDLKRAMPFISVLKQRLASESPATVFDRKLTFDETSTLISVAKNIEKAPASVNVAELEIISFNNGSKEGTNVLTGEKVPITITGKIIDATVPGEPGILFTNI